MLARHWCLIPIILATWEAEIGRITVQSQPSQTVQETPPPKLQKLNRAKLTGGVAKVVKHQLIKHEALSSKPRPTKKSVDYLM
jgi:hypothetical protein